MFLLISKNYTSPLEIPIPSLLTLALIHKITCFKCPYLNFYKILKKPITYPLRPITMNNASSSCFTATAGTGICQNFLPLNTVIFFFNRKDFTTKCRLHPWDISGSNFRSLSKYSPLLTPIGV